MKNYLYIILFGTFIYCDYNSNKFDIPLLAEEFLRVGIDFDMDNRKAVDIQNIFHKMEQRTLVAAYQFYCNKDLKKNKSSFPTKIAAGSNISYSLDSYIPGKRNLLASRACRAVVDLPGMAFNPFVIYGNLRYFSHIF